jgi:uncharacterized protein YjiS (DUF1127 family)
MIIVLICLVLALIGWGFARVIGAGLAILTALILAIYGYASLTIVLGEYRERRHQRRELKRKRPRSLRYQRNVAATLRREIEQLVSETEMAYTRRHLERLEQEAIKRLGLSRRQGKKAQRPDWEP